MDGWQPSIEKWIHISGHARKDPGPATDLRQPAPGNVPAQAPENAPDPGSFGQWDPAKDNFLGPNEVREKYGLWRLPCHIMDP